MMATTGETGLYELLEKILFDAKEPLDCQQIYDMAEVRKYAASAARVSDYLGNIWRNRKTISRLPNPDSGRGAPRWKYVWKSKVPPSQTAIEYAPKLIVSKPTVLITEEGDTIQIEMPELTILIKQKKPER